ncbi:MAG: glycosyltransferase family 39 protein [Acidobacteria bacterium]|nr:glycosyltransferase family 39 protein [Acidobacteriota bacterium]
MSPLGHVRSDAWGLALVLLGALVLRVPLAARAPSPGIADPTYYYNVARSLADGRGFEVDFLWQFHQPPADVTHQTNYYPPLAAVLVAGGMATAGRSVGAALIAPVVFGAVVLPLFAWALAGVAGLQGGGRLFAAAAVASMPEFVLNAVRTDTTIFFVPFAGLSLLGLGAWLAAPEAPRGRWWMAMAGLAAGLAYLTRLDGLLLVPTALVVLAVAARRVAGRSRWLSLGTALVAFLVPLLAVTAPWLVRNHLVLGTMFPVRLGQTMFVTEVLDLFTYGRTFTLQSYLDWGLGNITGKVTFEALGNAKMMVVLLAAFAPFVLAGLGMLAGRLVPERPRLVVLLPAVVFLAGAFAYYTALVPLLSQSGSFKKAVMTLVPFGAVVGAWAVQVMVPAARGRAVLQAAVSALLVFQALDLVRSDFRRIEEYEAMLAPTRAALDTLPDSNGDGRVVVMTQDPFQWNYYGYAAVMLPNDDRDTIVEAARRYAVDYFVFPADRAALDAVQHGEEDDPRLQRVWRNARTGMAIYRLVRQ